MMTYYRGRYGDKNDYYLSLAKGMSQLVPMVVSLSMLFGFITWGMVLWQYDWTVVQVFGSQILGWVVLIVLLVSGFWGVLQLKRNYQRSSEIQWALGIFVMACMLAITGIFVSSHIGMLNLSSGLELATTNDSTVPDVSTLWPRFFHSVFSGFAITGLVLTIYGSLRPQCREDHEVDPAPYDIRLVRYGVGWVLGGTVPQIVVGPWFLLALPSDVRFHLIDGTTVVSLIFFISLTLTLLTLVLLNSSLIIPHKRGLVWGGVGSLTLTIVFMVLIREEVRKLWMSSYGMAVGPGELSWIVVITLVIMTFMGLYLGGRYVTLSHKQTTTS